MTDTEVVETPTPDHHLRVVIADDDTFTVSLVGEGLKSLGFDVTSANNAEAAWQLICNEEPHALVTDLDFGPGESGAHLLKKVSSEFPWIGLVVLTSHRSPELAVIDSKELPPGAVYLVKSQLRRVEDVSEAIAFAIAGQVQEQEAIAKDAIVLTSSQAEVLRMIASGASTRALAEHRGTTVRAAETMLNRVYQALGLKADEQSNPRVEAVRLWQQGRITVK
jgi:DNA-binding NarL/FixJ family response regulator